MNFTGFFYCVNVPTRKFKRHVTYICVNHSDIECPAQAIKCCTSWARVSHMTPRQSHGGQKMLSNEWEILGSSPNKCYRETTYTNFGEYA